VDDAAVLADDIDRLEELRVRLVLTRSWTIAERDGHGAGRLVLAEATDLARALQRRDLVTLCLSQGATMLGRSGDLAGSLDLMHRAEVGLDTLPAVDQARLLVNRGTLGSHLMRLDDARRDLARAAELARAIGSGTIEFMARHNQGYVEFLRGDLPSALTLMDAADDMHVEVSRTVAQLDRARVLLEAGLLTEAAETLRQARDLAQADAGGDQDLGEIELDLARARLLLGDAAGSARVAARARRRFRARASGGWRRTALLVELEAAGADRSRPQATARLADLLRQAAHAHGETHLTQRAALIAADAYLDLGDTGRAHAAYRIARPLVGSGSLATRLHLRLVAARLADRPHRAGQALAAAADDLALAQQRASSLDLRTAFAVHSGRLAALDLDLGVASGSVVSLYTRSERWRAVSDRVPFVRPPRDEQAAGLLTRLRRLREDLRSAPAEAQAGLREDAAALERRIRSLDWARGCESAATGDARPPRPIPYAEALAAVRQADVTLATYLPHAGHLYAVVLTPRGGRIERLVAMSEVQRLVQRVRADVEAATLPGLGPMRAAVEASLGAGLRALDAALLAPLADRTARGPGRSGRGGSVSGGSGGRRAAYLMERLVVVPSNALVAVPWGMLPSRHGRPTTVARTVTGWAAAAASGPVRAPRVLAIAGPELDHADREVAAVGRAWAGHAGAHARVVVGPAATLDAVAGALMEQDLVHIAAHGRHHHQSPLFSTLRLADGSTFAHELPAVGVGASHVVLSACEVGRATIRPGDESLGLTAVLLSLGVGTVVAAVSRIPDDLAAETMTTYHQRLATGVEAAQALAEATADLPLAAGAFTCFGGPWRVG
jgi:tetratricopeptide (TPR) repeat protein